MKYIDIINKIQDEKLRKLGELATTGYGSANLETDAVEVSKWVEFVLCNDKLIAENSHALFVDILFLAAAVHNLTYKYGEVNFEKLFKTRKLLTDLNEEAMVPDTYLESVCQTIEGQLGKDHPMVLLIPNPNTPGAHFSLACSIYYKTNNTIK